MSPESYDTLIFLCECRTALSQRVANTMDRYILARVQKLPVLCRHVAAEIHADEAALVLHDALIRSYLQEVIL